MFLVPFNRHMHLFVRATQETFVYGHTCYIHNQDELTGDAIPEVITGDHARALLDSGLQGRILENAREAAGYAAKAAEILRRDALQYLPELDRELSAFVEGYIERSRITNERSQSWVPSLIQDFFLGAITPVTFDVSQVEALPRDLKIGSGLLMELPVLFEELATHYTLLSKLSQSDMVSMGYSSTDDLRRLYSDRLTCARYISEMDRMTWSLDRAFASGFRNSTQDRKTI
jgi:hypothetical protein